MNLKMVPNESELLGSIEKDNNWLNVNQDELQKYKGKTIAVKDEKIIVLSDTIEEVIIELEKMDENPAFVLIETIPSKDVAFIL